MEVHELPSLDGWITLAAAAQLLDVSAARLTVLVIDGQFPSAHTIDGWPRLIVLKRREVKEYADHERDGSLTGRVPHPEPQARSQIKRLSADQIAEIIPPGPAEVTIESSTGNYLELGTVIVRPGPSIEAVDENGAIWTPAPTSLQIEDLAGQPIPQLEWATGDRDWSMTYVEHHNGLVVAGSRKGRAAIRQVATVHEEDFASPDPLNGLTVSAYGSRQLPVSVIAVTRPATMKSWYVETVYVRTESEGVFLHEDWDTPWGEAPAEELWTYFDGRIRSGSYGNFQTYELWGIEVASITDIAPVVTAYDREIKATSVFGPAKPIYIHPMETVPKKLTVSVEPARDLWPTAEPVPHGEVPEARVEDDRP